jgi:protein TonB
LALSLGLHLALVPLLWRKPFAADPVFESISVSFLPDPLPSEPLKAGTVAPSAPPRKKELARAKQRKLAVPHRRQPAAPAQPDLPLHEETAAMPGSLEPQPQIDQASATRGPATDGAAIFRNDALEKPVTKGDLLPGRRDLIGNPRAIPLNTADVRYASYTQTVKQWIESRWEYPDLAKQYGLQGRVVVEFTILQNGHIEFLTLVRSSGSKLLDEEAVRAIKAAVPFRPFPRSIQESSLRIIAGFIYSDQRLRVTDMQ